MSSLSHGNFTGLAEQYSKFRPGYSETVLKALVSILERPVEQSDLVDVGAGTGIWTRMLAKTKPHSLIAVEPNEEMRRIGILDSKNSKVKWVNGTGENTGLEDQSFDMVSMASSFHWVDFESGCREFYRILRNGGRFVTLWNPRLLEVNPLLVKLENYVYKLKPDMNRISSGKSGITNDLPDRLYQSGLFSDILYLEGRHTVKITPNQYVGAWQSVNDVQVQLGKEKFNEFIDYISEELTGHSEIEVTYLTRAWSAQKR